MEDSMTSFLPRDVVAALRLAQDDAARKRSRLRIDVDGRTYPVLRLWDNGFALADDAPHLRGLVELYDGGRLLRRCLIVAAEEDSGETRYEFKRLSEILDEQPVDFERRKDAPVAFLTAPDMG
jgi:hypothetical protein